nr:retrovirus-related Pol polyprotein from transposon TNT 1-94 [Tanacetum cinerariifolium]
MRPFACPVTILNTLDSLGKFDGKVDEGFLVGYSPNVVGSGPTWLFDIDSLIRTMNYQPVTARNQTNPSVGFEDKFEAEKAGEESNQQYVLFPVWSSGYRDFSAEFEDFSDNSINEVNATSTLVPTVEQISPNSTNTFSTVELEDITYYVVEDDVGSEADFNNLETSITVSPIPTSRVHKDHPDTNH